MNLRQNFNHFILTKFNIKAVTWRGTIDDTWIEERINLFEKFCYPSVRNQTNLNFKWLVFFDVNTPPKYKNEIEKYKSFKNFIPFYINYYFRRFQKFCSIKNEKR